MFNFERNVYAQGFFLLFTLLHWDKQENVDESGTKLISFKVHRKEDDKVWLFISLPRALSFHLW